MNESGAEFFPTRQNVLVEELPLAAWKEFGAGETGVSSAALNGTPSTSWLKVSDYDCINFFIKLVRVAATDISATLQTSLDCNAAFNPQGFTLAQPTTVSATTYMGNAVVTTAAAAISANWAGDIQVRDLNCNYIRLYAITGTASGATDLVTVTARAKRLY